MPRTRRPPPLARLTFAISSPDFALVRAAAQKEGVPYTVWIRSLVHRQLRKLGSRPSVDLGRQGQIVLSVPFEIHQYDRLRKAALQVDLPHGELSRRAVLRLLEEVSDASS